MLLRISTIADDVSYTILYRYTILCVLTNTSPSMSSQEILEAKRVVAISRSSNILI